MPAFSKVASILNFMTEGKAETMKKFNDAPEDINLLKTCDEKISRVIFMRYKQFPEKVRIPFLNYYHDLVFDVNAPNIPKNIFISNTRADLKTICTLHSRLNFSDNKRIDENILFSSNLGLFGNFRKLHPKTDSVYFFPIGEEHQQA